jgi:hypothetical protein
MILDFHGGCAGFQTHLTTLYEEAKMKQEAHQSPRRTPAEHTPEVDTQVSPLASVHWGET